MTRLACIAGLVMGAVMVQPPSGEELIRRVDQNMFADSRTIVAQMIIHGRRDTRTVESRTWQRGTTDAFTEYLAPAREKGTKMLKLADNLWTYDPGTDRTILISGSMLHQSVMGSDLSYDDLMEDPRLEHSYDATVSSQDSVDGRRCWVVDLQAKIDGLAYERRRAWIDAERFVPLKEELYAKSGKLLKTMELSGVRQIGGRWVPTHALYRDVLKQGGGTEFVTESIDFNVPLPDYLFSKAALRK